MSLPDWDEKHKEKCFQAHCSAYSQALALAWEALSYYRELSDDSQTADEAMMAIEDLGE